MRRIAVLLFALWIATSVGCEAVSSFFRDGIFGGLAENYDSSRPRSERRAAYDNYIRENVDSKK